MRGCRTGYGLVWVAGRRILRWISVAVPELEPCGFPTGAEVGGEGGGCSRRPEPELYRMGKAGGEGMGNIRVPESPPILQLQIILQSLIIPLLLSVYSKEIIN